LDLGKGACGRAATGQTPRRSIEKVPLRSQLMMKMMMMMVTASNEKRTLAGSGELYSIERARTET
jgi:hypothetical protein